MNLVNAINLFPTISLEEMNSVKLMDRIETKFLLNQNQLPAIFEQVQKDYRIVSINDNKIPEYKTVYFDTENFFFFNEHQRKRNDRYKVRFRNYVESHLTFFEVKHKKNGRVDKKRIEVENEIFELDQEKEEFLSQSNLKELKLSKKLSNYYSRITLVNKHSIERVTFDLNIRFSFKEQKAKLENLVIVELKQAELSRTSPIYQALKEANIKPFNMSKYCIGLIKTYGLHAVKYNRFKKKLLKIDKIIGL